MTTITATDRTQWAAFVALEPRLALLLGQIQAIQDDPAQPGFCANAHWYGAEQNEGLKETLCQLVGWEASPESPPILRTAEAYDTCYTLLYAALPDCRNCSCLSGAV
jgi:hypothetical protein